MAPHVLGSGDVRDNPELEYEKLTESSSSDDSWRDTSLERADASTDKPNDSKLALCFFFLVFFGSFNAVFGKLQTIPMYNYPNFLNLFGTFCYIPLTFAYIIPVSKYGLFNNAISAEQLALPKRPFAIMGCLDCIAGMMQTFASVYLPGPLLILLPQAAIPISMIFSKHILDRRYRKFQYVGAVIVLMGILVVLEPMVSHRHAAEYVCQALNEDEDCSICRVETSSESCLSHRLDVSGDVLFPFQRNRHWGANGTKDNDDDEGQPICEWVAAAASAANGEAWQTLAWSLIMIVSCVPMTLSSIYKEISMGDETELDPVYLNGWIAVFQFCFSLILAVPAGMASSPPVDPQELPRNIYNGILCYLGISSVENGCHPDDMCASHAALLVNLSLFMNIVCNILMMYILKFGSANVLFLALTVMVPIGNLAFALPFMPQRATFRLSDLLGLGVIMAGVVLYRFADKATKTNERDLVDGSSKETQLQEPLLTGDV